MKELKKKFFFVNEKGEKVDLKIEAAGSMWILAYGYDAVAEWKRVRNEELKNKKSENDIEDENNDEKLGID